MPRLSNQRSRARKTFPACRFHEAVPIVSRFPSILAWLSLGGEAAAHSDSPSGLSGECAWRQHLGRRGVLGIDEDGAHVHALCSRGGWTARGEWFPLPYVDEAAAERLFRHKVIGLLRRDGLLSQERSDLLNSWRRSGSSVHNRVFVHPRDARSRLPLHPPELVESPRRRSGSTSTHWPRTSASPSVVATRRATSPSVSGSPSRATSMRKSRRASAPRPDWGFPPTVAVTRGRAGRRPRQEAGMRSTTPAASSRGTSPRSPL